MSAAAKTKIRVMVVEDHVLVRMGLIMAAETEPDIQVVATAADGEEALGLYRKHRPDVVIMDLRLPGMDGIATTAALRKEFGAVRVVVLTSFGTEEGLGRAVEAGARACVLKEMPLQQMVEAIRAVYAGKEYFPPEIAQQLVARAKHPELSPREVEVLRLIAQGRSNKEIGNALGIVEGTVKLHVKSLLEKMGAADRTEAATNAIKRGILSGN
jgi:DNA-binding NarL/FixJ family response regulator